MSIIDRFRRLRRSTPYVIPIPSDFDRSKTPTIEKVRPYTMTGVERIYHLIMAVEYVVANDLSGSFVECGVWKGGSMMAVALTLLQLGDTSRELRLYDTFEGNPACKRAPRKPAENDRGCVLGVLANRNSPPQHALDRLPREQNPLHQGKSRRDGAEASPRSHRASEA
jgi:hypothetical protein